MECPLCNSTNNKIVYNYENFIVLQCQDCQLYFQQNYFSKKELFNFYSIDYGINRGKNTDIKNPKKIPFDENKYRTYLNKNLRPGLRPFIDKFTERKNILEIGADAGGATRYMIGKGHNVEVVELFEDYVKKFRNENIVVYNDLFENIEFDKKYDVIVALEVIEHFSNPVFCIDKIYDLLNDNGYFIFETPVAKEGLVEKTTYGIQPAHYCVFNNVSLKILLKKFKDIPKFNHDYNVNEVYCVTKK